MATGIDFSFSRVPPAVARAAGHSFAVSYLTDLDTAHRVKAWTTAEVAAYRAAGLGVVAVWQGGGSDRTTAWRGGYDRGRRDALRAATQATALGRPPGRPVYFAIDADAAAADLALISRYFDGVGSVFDVGNIGVYGSRRTIEWAMGSGRASWFWQTDAWSGGVRVPGIHLYQRVPSTRLGGYDIDIDDAMQPDYGAWWGGVPMPDLWMPGATRLDIGDHAALDGGPAKAIGHITWDRNATAAKPADLVSYETLVQYFGRNPDGMRAAPHIIWDPFTGRITQLLPANSRSKSVVDVAGGTRTNRAGSVVLQIEAVFFPYCRVDGQVYARLVDTPCKGWAQLNAWVRSWGVPDAWPMGRPTSFAANRSESVWETTPGWYGHSQVPENDHQDPGSWPGFTSVQEDDDMTPQERAALVAEVTAAVVAALPPALLDANMPEYARGPQREDGRPGYLPSIGECIGGARFANSMLTGVTQQLTAIDGKVAAPAPVQVDAASVAAALGANAVFVEAVAEESSNKTVAKLLAALAKLGA